MRKSIVRTITATTIESANVQFVKGKPVTTSNDPIVLNGIVADENALKEVRKAYGVNAQVVDIKQVAAVYEISVEDFIKYAKKVEMPTVEQTQEGATE